MCNLMKEIGGKQIGPKCHLSPKVRCRPWQTPELQSVQEASFREAKLGLGAVT